MSPRDGVAFLLGHRRWSTTLLLLGIGLGALLAILGAASNPSSAPGSVPVTGTVGGDSWSSR